MCDTQTELSRELTKMAERADKAEGMARHLTAVVEQEREENQRLREKYEADIFMELARKEKLMAENQRLRDALNEIGNHANIYARGGVAGMGGIVKMAEAALKEDRP